MISFPCPHCRKSLKVKDNPAGKKVKCPGCGQVVQVPRSSTPVPRPAAAGREQPGEPAVPSPEDVKAETRSQAPPPPQSSDRETLSQPGSAEEAPGEALDFLRPAQDPGELGWLGSFRVLQVLGQGGMGVVFLAEDPRLKRKVAIKVMKPALAISDSARKRFLHEAQAAAALAHDYIIPVLHVEEDQGIPYLIMPLLQGETLEDRLKREGTLPLAAVLRLGREIAEGLQAARERGLIHRDIKPANIWLEVLAKGKWRIKILDFGLARAVSDDASISRSSGGMAGTPAYMPPEALDGVELDARSDLFSLGCVLYRSSTGKLPFTGKTASSLFKALALDTPPAPQDVNPELPEALSALIMQLLAKKPEERPTSAQEVAKALTNLEAALPAAQHLTSSPPVLASKSGQISASFPGPSVPAPAPTRLRGPRVAVVAVLAGSILAALVLYWPTPQGLVRIESDDPSMEIVFDQTGPTIKGADKEPIQLRAGEHGLLIKRGNFEFEAPRLVLKKGATTTLKVELLPGKMQLLQDGQVFATKAMALPKTYTNSFGMEFVLVPKGKSWLGGGRGQPGQKEVEIKEDFYLGKYEVTQEEWAKVMGAIPSAFSRFGADKESVKDISDADLKRFPVEQVTADDAQLFLGQLNKRDQEEGWVYRLPKEVEWEYACRDGPMNDRVDSAFDYYFDKPVGQLQPEQANFGNGKGLKRTCKVGSYQPNKLGLYDMHGNVSEWCEDVFDPKAPQEASRRAARGGSWWTDPEHCRAGYRYTREPPYRHISDFGLRLARVPVGAASK